MTVMASIPTTRPGIAGPLNLNPQPGDAPAAERFAELFEGELPLESGGGAAALPVGDALEEAPDVTDDAAAIAEIAALLQSATPPPPIMVRTQTVPSDAATVDVTPVDSAPVPALVSAQTSSAVTIGNVALAVPTTVRALPSAIAGLAGATSLAAIASVSSASSVADTPAPEVAQALGRIARLIEETISGVGDAGEGNADGAPDQPQSAIAEQLAALRKSGALPAVPAAKSEATSSAAATTVLGASASLTPAPAAAVAATPTAQTPPQAGVAEAIQRLAVKRAGGLIDRATLAPPTESPRSIDGISVGWRTVAPSLPATTVAKDGAGLTGRADGAPLQPAASTLTPSGPAPASPDFSGISAELSAADNAGATLSTNGQASAVQTVVQAAANTSAAIMPGAGAGANLAPATTATTAPSAEEAIAHQLTLAADGEWLDQLATDIARTAGADGQMRFTLNPRTLGSMMVEVRQSDLGAVIHLATDTEAARAIVAEAQPRLLAEARAQGLRIADAQVLLHNQASGSGTGQSQHNGQPPAESMIRTAGSAETPNQSPPERRPAARSARYA